MKVMIAGGGTGGHLFPGLALAEEFKRRDAGTEIVFVGTEHGIEAKIIPRITSYKVCYTKLLRDLVTNLNRLQVDVLIAVGPEMHRAAAGS